MWGSDNITEPPDIFEGLGYHWAPPPIFRPGSVIMSPPPQYFVRADELREVYAGDIDFVALTRQLTSLQDVSDDESKPIKYIKTICEIVNNSPIYKRSFSEVHILLLIYLTIPVTTATCERTFSVLKRIKTSLISTMTQRKLNQSLILHIYKSRTDKLNLKTIAQNFVSRNTRRQNFFGTFVWGCMKRRKVWNFSPQWHRRGTKNLFSGAN